MNIDKIREKLAEQISMSQEWADKLSDTSPGHYGIWDWEVEISKGDIKVNIPKRTFTLDPVKFYFKIQLMSSNDEDGTKMAFSKMATGHGAFEFRNDREILIEDLEIEMDLYLFADEDAITAV